ncbi:MAG: AAA family ATPase [Vicingaceae bacterium]
MHIKPLSELITSLLPFKPTSDQNNAILKFQEFITAPFSPVAYVLKGYAGTGKTSLIAAFSKALKKYHFQTVLLAPTGRAAKVMSNYSGRKSFTIHKIIYSLKPGADGILRFQLNKNKFKNTVFIVDEASMIGNEGGLTFYDWGKQTGLLDDLMSFVFDGENCKLMLVGDTAQLPPVHLNISPALDEAYLTKELCLKVYSAALTEVVRQAKDSGILYNATYLRSLIKKGSKSFPKFQINFPDIQNITGEELQDLLDECYGKYGEDETIVITRSNKRAILFNKQIRARIKWLEEDIATGDYLLICKNNYFWLVEQDNIGFIANGDIAEIQSINKREELYGFHFADVTLRMVDYPDHSTIDVKIILESIDSESPALTPELSKQLYEAVAADYADIPDRRKKRKLIRENPYYQALQVKFAYAVTCHKAQGGQWDAVFVDQGYLTEEMIGTSYYRWLYTAFTRAKKKLYLINFHRNLIME